MANEKAAAADDGLAGQVAALAARITGIEQTLAAKIPGFEQVGGRVAELSTAFQAANQRLAAFDQRLTAIEEEPPAAGEEALAALASALDNLAVRLAAVEQVRTRGGRLSRRLADIEARLPPEEETAG